MLVTSVVLCRLCYGFDAAGQGSDNPLFADPDQYFGPAREAVPVRITAKDIWNDQKAIWTSPLRVKKSDVRWLLPLAGVAGLLLATDSHTASLIHTDAANRSLSTKFSDAGLAAFAGSAMISYGIDALTYNPHTRETGRLTAQAMANALLVSEALKFATERTRPQPGLDTGQFWQRPSLDSSFPSEHAALAWSAAAVLAREYPGPVMQWSAYGLASLVSLSRITASQHFPTDVLIGAAAGYLIGRYVYNAHHNDDLSDRTGSTPVRKPEDIFGGESRPKANATAPVYVPLDSWIYPALKRLAALGFIPSQVSDAAPWTRAECLRQVAEAEDHATSREFRDAEPGGREEALRLIGELKTALGGESAGSDGVRLESVYSGVTAIRGKPLDDSYHFGQTIWDNYGRPYGEGFNDYSGASISAAYGPFSAYFRGEYQYGSAPPAESGNVLSFISRVDGTPLQSAGTSGSTSRFQPVEMYAGVHLGFENVTFGEQSLWWGPGEDSAFAFSNNAAPFYMLRMSQAAPLILPGPLAHLGKLRTEIIFGKLSGHHYPARPYMNAQKISLDLTDNLEVGFTRSAFFGGVGHPLTFSALENSLFSVNSVDFGPYGSADLPGDRHSSFDFRWRLPGLRRYVTIYSDSYADDEPNPIDSPRRSAWGPGIYISQLPGLRRMDFRFETYSTWLYNRDYGGNFLYWDNQYRDSYTNDGTLLGSWIGRDARAYDGTVSYWLSGKSRIAAQYRQIKTGTSFLPGGGTQTDVSLSAHWGFTDEWLLTAEIQYERYFVPVLGGPQNDVMTCVEITFTPKKAVWRP